MFDAKKLLDALVGAGSQDAKPARPAAPAVKKPAAGGQTSDMLMRLAKDFVVRNPKLVEAGIIGLTGLLFGKGKVAGGVAGKFAKLGGLAVIGALAYKALRGKGSSQALLDMGAAGGQSRPGGPTSEVPFDPVSYTEDDAVLFLRAMAAAVAADGVIDQAERERISHALGEAGIEPEATQWLEAELADPADVEELAERVNSPEMAAKVYAAARIAIDPDTRQEREFLRQLALALDLDPDTKSQIDDGVEAIRAEGE